MPKHHLNIFSPDAKEAADLFQFLSVVLAAACVFFGLLLTFLPPIQLQFLWILLGTVPGLITLVGTSTYDKNFTGKHRRAIETYRRLDKDTQKNLGFNEKDLAGMSSSTVSDFAFNLEVLVSKRALAAQAEQKPKIHYMQNNVKDEIERQDSLIKELSKEIQ